MEVGIGLRIRVERLEDDETSCRSHAGDGVSGGLRGVGRWNAGALSTTPEPPGLSGRVLSEAGTPLEGVQVVVHERTTNRRTRQVSDADGSFVLALEPGVYDLGLDLEGAPEAATSFYGPIAVTSAVRRDFVLHSVEGRGADQVFGKIWLRPGVPAANRQVAPKRERSCPEACQRHHDDVGRARRNSEVLSARVERRDDP